MPSHPSKSRPLFIDTSSIFYLGLAIARLTGEDLLGKEQRSPFFDRVFFYGLVEAFVTFRLRRLRSIASPPVSPRGQEAGPRLWGA